MKRLIGLEEAEERREQVAALRDWTPKEREQRGKALLHLALDGRHYDVAEHLLLVFSRHS